jgi:hypothetical protein
MNKYLLIIVLTFLCAGVVRAQGSESEECRDFKPAEQALWKRVVDLFDASVKSKCATDNWDVSTKVSDYNNGLVGAKSLPERPFTFCGYERMHMNILFPWWQALSDSVQKIDGQVNPLAAKVIEIGNNATDANQLQKQLDPYQKKIHDLHYKEANLTSQYGAEMLTDLNSPYFILCLHSAGPVPYAAHKINLPGAAVAYVLDFHDDDVGDKHVAVIGLGNWHDNLVGRLDFNQDIMLSYHFVHRYPSLTIENMTFTITTGRRQDLMTIINKIDWAKMSQIVSPGS